MGRNTINLLTILGTMTVFGLSTCVEDNYQGIGVSDPQSTISSHQTISDNNSPAEAMTVRDYSNESYSITIKGDEEPLDDTNIDDIVEGFKAKFANGVAISRNEARDYISDKVSATASIENNEWNVAYLFDECLNESGCQRYIGLDHDYYSNTSDIKPSFNDKQEKDLEAYAFVYGNTLLSISDHGPMTTNEFGELLCSEITKWSHELGYDLSRERKEQLKDYMSANLFFEANIMNKTE